MYKEGTQRQKQLDALMQMNLRTLARELTKSQGRVAHWKQLYESTVKGAPPPANSDTSELHRAR